MSERVDTPFVGNVATPRKLAFFRKVGAGDPMWSGSCIYGLTGATPSVSQYDADDTLSDRFSDQMPYHVRAGVVTERRLVDRRRVHDDAQGSRLRASRLVACRAVVSVVRQRPLVGHPRGVRARAASAHEAGAARAGVQSQRVRRERAAPGNAVQAVPADGLDRSDLRRGKAL
jgi:hypothetical protein